MSPVQQQGLALPSSEQGIYICSHEAGPGAGQVCALPQVHMLPTGAELGICYPANAARKIAPELAAWHVTCSLAYGCPSTSGVCSVHQQAALTAEAAGVSKPEVLSA